VERVQRRTQPFAKSQPERVLRDRLSGAVCCRRARRSSVVSVVTQISQKIGSICDSVQGKTGGGIVITEEVAALDKINDDYARAVEIMDEIIYLHTFCPAHDAFLETQRLLDPFVMRRRSEIRGEAELVDGPAARYQLCQTSFRKNSALSARLALRHASIKLSNGSNTSTLVVLDKTSCLS
jgi:hypothetical protein